MVSPLITVDIIPGWITFFVWPAGWPPELKMICRQDKQWHWSNNSYLHTLQGSIDSTKVKKLCFLWLKWMGVWPGNDADVYFTTWSVQWLDVSEITPWVNQIWSEWLFRAMMNKHNYSTSGLCWLLYTIRLLFNTTNYRQYCSTWQICHVATCTSSASSV